MQPTQELAVLDPLTVGEAAAPQTGAFVERVEQQLVIPEPVAGSAGRPVDRRHHLRNTVRPEKTGQQYGRPLEFPAAQLQKVTLAVGRIDPVRPGLPVEPDRQNVRSATSTAQPATT